MRTWEVYGEHPDAPAIEGAPPTRFMGKAGRWSPEDFFLAGLNSCQLAYTVYHMKQKRIKMISYDAEISGDLDMDESGEDMQFVEIIIRPKIVVKGEENIETVREVVQISHDQCLVGKSISTTIRVIPEITAE